MLPFPLDKREFHIILASSTFVPESAHVVWNLHGFEFRIVRDALEKGNGESWSVAGGGREDAVSGAETDASGESFETLADGDDEGAFEGGTWERW